MRSIRVAWWRGDTPKAHLPCPGLSPGDIPSPKAEGSNGFLVFTVLIRAQKNT
jgi:hypothetical protein